MKTILRSENDTKKLAYSIAKQLHGGEILALTGELGAGKTTFTQYLSQALGVKKHVNSPTFVIMKIYEINPRLSSGSSKKGSFRHLAHLDAYRIDNPAELNDLGLDLYINEPSAIVVIEWADKIKNYLKKYSKVTWINFHIENKKRFVNIGE